MLETDSAPCWARRQSWSCSQCRFGCSIYLVLLEVQRSPCFDIRLYIWAPADWRRYPGIGFLRWFAQKLVLHQRDVPHSSDGPISWGGKSLFRLQEQVVSHVKTTHPQLFPTLQWMGRAKETIQYMSLVKVSYHQPSVCFRSPRLGYAWRQLSNSCAKVFSDLPRCCSDSRGHSREFAQWEKCFFNNSTCTHRPVSGKHKHFLQTRLWREWLPRRDHIAAVSQLPAEAINWTSSKAFGKYESLTEQHV